ncbi:hypothetical protein NMY22_g4400 [Coprinellus aureogranulatus]|nr:hypothetical protein NMY22_g4400 [Coprinellus aureogranulatus]
MLCPLGPEDDDEDGDEMDCEAMTEAPTPRRKGSAPNPSTPRQPPPQPSFTTPGHYRPDSYEPSPLKKKTYYRAQTRLQSPLPPRTVVNPTSSLSTPSLSVAATTSSLASATARVSAATPAPPTAIPQSTNPYMALVGSSAWASSPSVWVSSPTPQAWQGASRPMSTSSLSAEWPPLPTAATPSAPSRPFIQYQPRK